MKKLFIIAQFFFFIFGFCYLVSAQSESIHPNYIYIQPRKIKDFIDKLNELGKLGYKLRLVERNTEFNPPENPNTIEIAGIVELREGDTFEYESFQSLTLSDFVEQISPKAGLGFYFSFRISFSIWKNPYEDLPEVTAEKGTTERDIQSIKRSSEEITRLMSQEPIDGSIFILERKNGQIKPINFKFATATPATSIFGTNIVDIRKINNTTESSINTINTIDYKPVSVFFSSTVFKTKVSHLPTILFQNDLGDYYDERPIYKVIGNNRIKRTFRKNVDKASGEGFRIVAITDTLSLTVKDNRKVSYVWLNPQIKDMTQKLLEVSNKGGRFVANATSYTTDSLIFETLLTDDGQRFNYKVLTLTKLPNLRGNNDSGGEFNSLVNQGFQPRALFYNDGMNVLFEKLKN